MKATKSGTGRLAAQVPAAGWMYDFCRTVSHAELQSIMAAAQAGVE